MTFTPYAPAAPYAGNIDTTTHKLAADFADVNVLVLGDSTAAQDGQWPDKLMPMVQRMYPHRTLQKATWDDATHSWGTWTQVGPLGTGSRLVKFWQGAVSGTVCEQPLNYWDEWVASVQPDLVVIHYGHNYGATAAGGGQPDDATMDQVFWERYLRLIASIRASCPSADVMVNSQNPYLADGARYQLSNVRAAIIKDAATTMGCAYGPVLEAFLAEPDPTLYLQADKLHPTTTGAPNGAQLAADALAPLFQHQPSHQPAVRVASPFVLPGVNLLKNGNFADFAAPPALPGWTAGAVTLSKDTTNYESMNGYSVKIAAAVQANAANATIYQPLPIHRVRGQVITCAARFFIPTGQGSQPGRVQLSGDGLTSITSGTLTNVRDQWVWAFATARVPAAAAYATFSILAGAAGPSTTDQCLVDRASTVLGRLPRDTN